MVTAAKLPHLSNQPVPAGRVGVAAPECEGVSAFVSRRGSGRGASIEVWWPPLLPDAPGCRARMRGVGTCMDGIPAAQGQYSSTKTNGCSPGGGFLEHPGDVV